MIIGLQNVNCCIFVYISWYFLRSRYQSNTISYGLLYCLQKKTKTIFFNIWSTNSKAKIQTISYRYSFR